MSNISVRGRKDPIASALYKGFTERVAVLLRDLLGAIVVDSVVGSAECAHVSMELRSCGR